MWNQILVPLNRAKQATAITSLCSCWTHQLWFSNTTKNICHNSTNTHAGVWPRKQLTGNLFKLTEPNWVWNDSHLFIILQHWHPIWPAVCAGGAGQGKEKEKCSVQCQQCMHVLSMVADILPWSLRRERLVSSSDAAALCNDTLWQSSQTTIDRRVQHLWHARGLKWGLFAAPLEDFISSVMSFISFFPSSSLLSLCPWWVRRLGTRK